VTPSANRRWRRWLVGGAVVAGGGSLFNAALVASATSAADASAPSGGPGASTLYAYATGGATSPKSCPRATTASEQCSLAEALSKAVPGTKILLASSSRAGPYIGNWAVRTPGTSSSRPITIEPAPGVAQPTLGGNGGQSTGCGTSTCDGPVLTVGPKVHLDLDGLTIRNADNTTNGLGGAIQNIHGGTVTVSHCTFSHDYANASGGAIDNGGVSGTGTLIVLASLFTGNYAVNADGGAIANADVGGNGSVTVSGSDFSANSAINGNGGAIDSGDTRGTGTLSVSASSFVGNIAGRAGAIDNGDNGTGTLTVRGSTFSNNVAVLDDGGAIDNADWGGTGTLDVTGSTFTSDKTIGDGGAIDNADNTGSRGQVVVSTSTFWGNIADVHGGAIDSSDVGSEGTVVVSLSTFSRNTANNIYAEGTPGGGAINVGKNGTFWVVGDIFDGPCRSTGGVWDDQGYNVGRDGSCLKDATGDVDHGANHLGPLADHGGATETSLPLSGNPALNRIPYHTSVTLDNQALGLCPTVDQRGKRSDAKRSCDAGSVQSSG